MSPSILFRVTCEIIFSLRNFAFLSRSSLHLSSTHKFQLFITRREEESEEEGERVYVQSRNGAEQKVEQKEIIIEMEEFFFSSYMCCSPC